MNVGDLVRRLSVPLRLGVVVDVVTGSATRYAKVLYSDGTGHRDGPRWVSFDLLEVINESR